MSQRSAKVARLLAGLSAGELDPRYAGFFALFNQQRFHEAHDVLEELWLERRRMADEKFYKGLIQLAGAFVHLQRNRLQPAAALLRLARARLGPFAPRHERLDVVATLALSTEWLDRLEGLKLRQGSGDTREQIPEGGTKGESQAVGRWPVGSEEAPDTLLAKAPPRLPLPSA